MSLPESESIISLQQGTVHVKISVDFSLLVATAVARASLAAAGAPLNPFCIINPMRKGDVQT